MCSVYKASNIVQDNITPCSHQSYIHYNSKCTNKLLRIRTEWIKFIFIAKYYKKV